MTPSSAHNWEFINESDLRKWKMQNAIMALKKYNLKLYLKSIEPHDLKLDLKLLHDTFNESIIEVYILCQLIFSFPAQLMMLALKIVNLLIFCFFILIFFKEI
ncbi:hypothetical protein LPTSP2_32160 [Leptospira ellinghausenii]|uniref:Uncharacterized protein n=1 Tax=Leptospira ellinghausenii TaxID=1917822 RepID=A0A2P2DGZ2_9LEPT|nr:hypothetical protein LPTSP2_32160 [Leptospira ellinghausenii]